MQNSGVSGRENEDVCLSGGDAPRRFCRMGVGWVERSETHHGPRPRTMGFAALYPSYGADVEDARCSTRTPHRQALPVVNA
jgi:hypothetical protein